MNITAFKYARIIAVMITAMTIMCSCSKVHIMESAQDRERKVINYGATELKEIIENSDNESLALLLEMTDVSEIDRFMNSVSEVEHFYVNYGAYEYTRGKESGTEYEKVRLGTGLIITDDNIYRYHMDFTLYDKEDLVIDRLWIVTAKTESAENMDYLEKYHFDSHERFKYADYYDSNINDYRLIWGKILEWKDASDEMELSDFDESDVDTLSIEGIKQKYGEYGAEYDTGDGYHILFYKTNEKHKYIAIFLNDDDTIDEVQETDEIGYGITGIEEVV